jgi:hypothetical protein
MILGTSKISLILGPINGNFWARGPRIYSFSYTKIPQKILESLWKHLGKYYFDFLELQKFVKFGPTKHLFCLKVFLAPPPKKIGISERFQRIFGGGILVF